MADISKLNLIGIVSPFCLLEFKHALARVGHGQMLEVLIQDPDVADDLVRLVDRSDDRLVERKRIDHKFQILVQRVSKKDISVKEEA